MYGVISKWAHPTAHAGIPLIDASGPSPIPRLIAEYDDDIFTLRTKEISLTAVFAGYALRNAMVDDRALHPDWRKEFFTLASTITGIDLIGLDTDWEHEKQRYDELQNRVRAATGLDEHLRRSPRSWDNLNRGLDSGGAPTGRVDR